MSWCLEDESLDSQFSLAAVLVILTRSMQEARQRVLYSSLVGYRIGIHSSWVTRLISLS